MVRPIGPPIKSTVAVYPMAAHFFININAAAIGLTWLSCTRGNMAVFPTMAPAVSLSMPVGLPPTFRIFPPGGSGVEPSNPLRCMAAVLTI